MNPDFYRDLLFKEKSLFRHLKRASKNLLQTGFAFTFFNIPNANDQK
jgi:hypothetical protein